MTVCSPLQIRNRSKDPDTCRQSSSAHTRSESSERAQSSSARKPSSPTRIVLSPFSSPVVAASAAIVCERLCMSAPSTIIRLVLLFTDQQLDARRTWLARGRCQAPIKSRRASRNRRRATLRKEVRPTGRQPETESQLAAGPGRSPARRTSPTSPNQNSKPCMEHCDVGMG
jgi:hypothetical protein